MDTSHHSNSSNGSTKANGVTAAKKSTRKEYNITNRSCEIVVNGLKTVTRNYDKTCKSVIRVLKASSRTKYKTHFCVAAMPEFMERIHSLDFSNRVIFLDGTGNANRFNCCVFVLMIDSHVGALPLGFFITSQKSASLLESTFGALTEILPNNAFTTPSFPKIVITGIDQAEHSSISKCFSTVKVFIGTFHLLRNVRKFLWDSSNAISSADRTQLFTLFQNIIHSQNEEQFNCNISSCYEHEVCKKYPEFEKYFSGLLKKKDLWGLDFRVRSNISYSKNILTSEKHVLKENILHNSRTYSVSALFEFFCTTYCDYYRRKILDATSGIIERLSEVRYMPENKDEISNLVIGRIGEDEVFVVNTKRNTEYCVSRELGMCTCVLGAHGTPCIHQYMVAAGFESTLLTIASMSLDEKGKYHYLANGLSDNVTSTIDDESKQDVDDPGMITEYVDVVLPSCDDEYEKITSEECVKAIETFWSKLSPHVDDHSNEIYKWISSMNSKLDSTKSFNEVLSVLYSNGKG